MPDLLTEIGDTRNMDALVLCKVKFCNKNPT